MEMRSCGTQPRKWKYRRGPYFRGTKWEYFFIWTFQQSVTKWLLLLLVVQYRVCFYLSVMINNLMILIIYPIWGGVKNRGERKLTSPPLLTSRKNLFLVISKGFTKGFTPCPNLLLQRWDCWSLKVRLVYYHTRKTSMVYQIIIPPF